LYNGIDMQEFNEEKDYGASRSRKVKRFLYAGGIWPHKGPHIAIEAFKIVAEKYPDVHFDLVGPQGEYPLAEACDLNDSESIKTLAPLFEKERLSFIKSKLSAKSRHGDRYFDSLQTRLGEFADKVTFHGFVSRSRLVELYYDSDIFVFPPIWNEAFGCTPLEAMAAGLPVVVSRCGGLTETVQDGRTGLVVNANDCDVLAQAMLRLLEDDHLRERMGQAARQRAVQCFSWEWVVRSMESGYKSLCRGESSPHGFNSHLNPQVAEDSLKLARVRSGD
jgi:glycosyltransferase involved in cell wall biosynthesis